MDNFYTSPTLFMDLEKVDTYASGTVRENRRNFPEELKLGRRQKLKRGEMSAMFCESVTAVHWFDKRDVLVLSTIYQDEEMEVNRRSGQSVDSISCPQIIQDYNQFMGGVNIADQHMVYYSSGRKGMKYWR